MISIICAIGKNREIGYQNRLLWRLPSDMRYFKETTKGHLVIMGQNTFESIGKKLPERENIILSLDPNFKVEGCEVSNNLEEILNRYKNLKDEVFVIGGASIYKQSIKHADRLYLTLVEDSPIADAYFPDYSEFKNIISESETQEENGIKFKFIKLVRKL